jgi:hypothetical protein
MTACAKALECRADWLSARLINGARTIAAMNKRDPRMGFFAVDRK